MGSGQVENRHKASSQAILDKFINRAENVSLNAIQKLLKGSIYQKIVKRVYRQPKPLINRSSLDLITGHIAITELGLGSVQVHGLTGKNGLGANPTH